jgi:hypothetical protein
MRACRVGAPRADAALAALRAEGFDPAREPHLHAVPDAPETRPEDVQGQSDDRASGAAESARDDAAEAATEVADFAVEPLVSGVAGAVHPRRARRDWITAPGVLIVGLAAAVLTFTTLRDLAQSVGITGEVLRVVGRRPRDRGPAGRARRSGAPRPPHPPPGGVAVNDWREEQKTLLANLFRSDQDR